MTSKLSQSASEQLSEGSKFQNVMGGMPPDPLQIAAYGRSTPSTVILKIFSPKLKILDRTLAMYMKNILTLWYVARFIPLKPFDNIVTTMVIHLSYINRL